MNSRIFTAAINQSKSRKVAIDKGNYTGNNMPFSKVLNGLYW